MKGKKCAIKFDSRSEFRQEKKYEVNEVMKYTLFYTGMRVEEKFLIIILAIMVKNS